MRVLIYSHGFPNPVEEHRSPFLKELIRFLPADIQLTVVAPVPCFLSRRRKRSGIGIPQVLTETLGNRQVEIHHPRFPLLPKNYLRPLMGWLEALFTLGCVKKIHRRAKIDLIHVNWAYPDGVAVSCLARWLKLPYVITEHQGSIADLLNIRYYNALIGRAYRQSRKLIVVSESLLPPLKLVRGGIPVPVVIPNGLDVSRFPLAVKRPHPSRLVYAGNLIPAKGVQFLIRALAILKGQGKTFSLDIIGDGAYRPELEELARGLNVQDRVAFLGAVPPARIPELLAEHDLLVLPTLVESFGIVLIEALASGLPVLSTHSGGPEHIVIPEVGTLVRPGSEQALATGILDLAGRWDAFDPQNIRQYCRERFDLSQISPRLAEIYRDAVDIK